MVGANCYVPQVAVNVFHTSELQTTVYQLPIMISWMAASLSGAAILYVFKEPVLPFDDLGSRTLAQ